MKFEQTLQEGHVAEWAQFYVDYGYLKHLVRTSYEELVISRVIISAEDHVAENSILDYADVDPKALSTKTRSGQGTTKTTTNNNNNKDNKKDSNNKDSNNSNNNNSGDGEGGPLSSIPPLVQNPSIASVVAATEARGGDARPNRRARERRRFESMSLPMSLPEPTQWDQVRRAVLSGELARVQGENDGNNNNNNDNNNNSGNNDNNSGNNNSGNTNNGGGDNNRFGVAGGNRVPDRGGPSSVVTGGGGYVNRSYDNVGRGGYSEGGHDGNDAEDDGGGEAMSVGTVYSGDVRASPALLRRRRGNYDSERGEDDSTEGGHGDAPEWNAGGASVRAAVFAEHRPRSHAKQRRVRKKYGGGEDRTEYAGGHGADEDSYTTDSSAEEFSEGSAGRIPMRDNELGTTSSLRSVRNRSRPSSPVEITDVQDGPSKAHADDAAAEDGTGSAGGAASGAPSSGVGGTGTGGDMVDSGARLHQSITQFVAACRNEWTRADDFLREETQRVRARMTDVIATLAGMALSRDRSTSDARTMEGALRALHSHISKLMRYVELNREAVRKAVKKFDKRIGTELSAVIKKELKVKGIFDDETAHILEVKVRHLFAQYFTHNNIAVATETLRARAEDAPHWRVFTLVGASIATVALLIYEVAANSDATGTDNGAFVLTTMRISYAITLLVLLFAGVLSIARKFRVNYRLVMGLDRRTVLGWAGFLEIASALTLLHGLLLTVYVRTLISENRGGDSASLPPWPTYTYIAAIPSIMILWAALPIRTLYASTRFFFWCVLGRIVGCFVFDAGFIEVFIADQLTSVTGFLVHAQFAICTASESPADAATSTVSAAGTAAAAAAVESTTTSCSLTSSPVIFILTMLPSLFRAVQCVRTYRMEGGVHPHLTNALKYSSNIITVMFALIHSAVAETGQNWTAWRYLWLLSGIMSSAYKFWWDVKMDWRLSWSLSDPTRGSKFRPFPTLAYSAAIVADACLRFVWLLSLTTALRGNEWWLTTTAYLEIVRRSSWNVLRIERDHYLNCVSVRAVESPNLPISKESHLNNIKAAMANRSHDSRSTAIVNTPFSKAHDR